MSILCFTSLRAVRSFAVARPSATIVHSQQIRYMGAGSNVHGQDPDLIAKEKARNLSGTQDSSAPHKEHAPGWNEHLASDSEAAVKADQAAPEGKPDKGMQDATVAHTHSHHHTDKGHEGAKHHQAKHNPASTASEDAVQADRGEH